MKSIQMLRKHSTAKTDSMQTEHSKTETLAAAAGRKHEIYCFNNGGSPGWLIAMAIADDGHCLAQHCCSHEAYMRHDLGMDDSVWKHESYNAHFGEGNWELIWIDDPKGDARLQRAYALNQKLAQPSGK